ncbi:Copper transport protein CCH [Striga hermonthica]|uniref:Copper transport protein CCH n=1 Tax=Striga hermonthica TaxID=68872 RepID=A0A9N7RH53_STRHE|nr:Copper transport protein CCH [Striga hermonthica]
MSQTVELKVAMSCQGCVGAVKRVLAKMEGIESFDIDIESQKVTVKGNVQPEAVFQTVSKTGKATSYWEAVEQPAAAEQTAAAEPPSAAEPTAATEPLGAELELKGAAAHPESKPAETITAAH